MTINRRYHRADLVVTPRGMAIACLILVALVIVLAVAS